MKIACIYMCTGEYNVFWKYFYESFEQNFLPDFEKEYFVFSDTDSLMGMETGKVHLHHIDVQPWPIPTLLKYHTFLMVEDKLKKFDYIYQPNANTTCRKEVRAIDFLPRKEYGETLFFTENPAKWFIEKYEYPYYRNPESCAFVPYNRSAVGVFGAMNGGEAGAYINFMKEMAERITIDLKKCIIPTTHDESYVNNYIVRHAEDKCIRYLPSDYAYPQEYDIPCDRIIELLDKNKYFNTADLKQIKTEWKKRGWYDKIKDRIKKYYLKICINSKKIRDKICDRKAR